METENISIEVVYALLQKQHLVTLKVQAGTTVAQAIELSGLKNQFPGMEIDPKRVGIFSVKTTLDTVLCSGDRVEIYRPLDVDPKESRRRRALAAKEAGVRN